MRDANVFSLRKGLPRMSWNPKNLFNIWNQTSTKSTTFTTTSKTMFQQRWKAKAMIRAYHGDFINEKVFKRWYLPDNLPDVRPRRRIIGDDKASLEAFATRKAQVQKEQVRKQEEDEKGLAPVGSLMLSEVERRLDVFVFRCCFVHSVYEARRLIIHGSVKLNGKKHSNAFTRLAPGDMVTVDPHAIRFLRAQKISPVDPDPESGESAETAESAAAEKQAESEESLEELERENPPPLSLETPAAEASAAPTQTDKLKTPAAEKLTPFNLPDYASPFLFIPAYIEVSYATCSAIYVRHPTARPGYSEIPTPYDADGEVVRLAWEWYARVRPRMRSRSQLARMPENRQESKMRGKNW